MTVDCKRPVVAGCLPGPERPSSTTTARPPPASSATTGADIIEAVYNGLGCLSKKESAEIVDLVFETLKATLERGQNIKISGFGNFVVQTKKARRGRNPGTGGEIEIPPRRVLKGAVSP